VIGRLLRVTCELRPAAARLSVSYIRIGGLALGQPGASVACRVLALIPVFECC
jgi:hypothetical protein